MSWATLGSACRRMCGGGYAPPMAARLFPGYAPGPGLALRIYLGRRPHQGRSPKVKKAPLRRGIATAAHQAAKPEPHYELLLRQSCEHSSIRIRHRNAENTEDKKTAGH